jgi:2-methylisocitrate lyase-like PEP mutase family enzyme
MNPFAKLHAGPDLLILPNAWDAGSARLIEIAGAKAIATSSAAVAWAHGYPDGEALPFEVLLATVREIARVVSVPITADIEMAYGADGNAAAEAVAKVVEAGAAGVNVEDGSAPPDLLVDKIAKIKARLGEAVWINARTDVYLKQLAEGEAAFAETAGRAQRYREAGADSIFIPFLADEAVLARLVAAIPAPINVLGPNLPSAARLKAIGVKRLSAGGGVAKVSFNRTFEAAQAFLTDGRSDLFAEPALVPGGFNAAMKRD